MCKVLALSALLANRNAKANGSAGAVVSTAGVFSTAEKGVPTHSRRSLMLTKESRNTTRVVFLPGLVSLKLIL